ncbi:unnamed protein product [Ceratitis capitata]|uniref:(Mediterranean fruit fly) hypothetical protein n=1 Tax=Ceratitis capitata TaxID=7213 RepID=A0A811VCC9_CERCA|nr:unnamed protein product [Ceratitis capitata]
MICTVREPANEPTKQPVWTPRSGRQTAKLEKRQTNKTKLRKQCGAEVSVLSVGFQQRPSAAYELNATTSTELVTAGRNKITTCTSTPAAPVPTQLSIKATRIYFTRFAAEDVTSSNQQLNRQMQTRRLSPAAATTWA